MPEPADDCRFFERGSAVLEMCDPASRQAAVRVCVPCCLFQAVTPHLLGAGTVDELRIAEPFAFWVPALTAARFAGAAAGVPGIAERANAAIREEVGRIGKVFAHLHGHLVDPSDLIPMLPLGTYVTFLFRCRVDAVPALLEGVESVPVVGVPEFQWALATVLAQALADFGRSGLLLTQSRT
jgi:hypothetical protein